MQKRAAERKHTVKTIFSCYKYKVTIKDADKQVVKSVRYNLNAELPAIEEFLARPGNEAVETIYHWMPEPLK